jgi:asparagine N-glycosylation enzyme membrane subunit Stt3
MVSPLEGFGYISSMFIDFFLPFLLIFALIYAVLAKTQQVSENSNVNAVIAFTIAFIFALSGMTTFISFMIPFFAVFFIVIVTSIIVLLFVGAKMEDLLQSKLFIGSLAVVVIIMLIVGSWQFMVLNDVNPFYVNLNATNGTVTPENLGELMGCKFSGSRPTSFTPGPPDILCLVLAPRVMGALIILTIGVVSIYVLTTRHD